ncbi:MAG: extracellular solute-binding protein [Anaerolineae bacterium]|nr:extracellular solute-binding protein [Anaerolineae bacterium]
MLDSFRLEGDEAGLYGFPTQFTVTGPFINRTLFEQAGVDVPSDMMEAPTWEDWEAAAREVAEVTGVPYAIAIDRSGHRFWGPSLSRGATYINEDGSMTVDSEGFRSTAEMLFRWHEEGVVPVEVWVGSGDQYADARAEFTNGQLVMYMSGSWQIGFFGSNIGDAFDWEAVPNPAGEGGSTGIPGGAVLGAMNTTEHPEEVALLMNYLIQQDVYSEFAARTLFLPGHLGVANAGVDYETDDQATLDALNTFLAEIPKLSDEAYGLQYSPIGFILNTNIRDRLTQVIVGEITLDEAIQRIQEAVDEAYAAQAGS